MEGKVKNPAFKKRELKITSIYSRSLMTRNIILEITHIGKNLKEIIEKEVIYNFEGKCDQQGYIKPGSIKVITFSSGLIKNGNIISFSVVFECEVCFPVEGTLISCKANSITKAGITAESMNEKPSPIIVFIARDHNYSNSYLSEILEGDNITVRVLGQRFELNDKFISVIGELVKPQIVKNK